MSRRRWRQFQPVFYVCVGVLLAWVGARAGQGSETSNMLSFVGKLTNDSGAPLGGSHAVVFTLRRGNATCSPAGVQVAVDEITGDFTAPIDFSACPTFFNGEDVTLDVTVDSQLLVSGQPITPVPYAKYSDYAVHPAPGVVSTIARRSRGPISLFVRVDGSDTLCDGTADTTAAGASSRACAFQTPQGAVDALPDVLRDAAVINISPGVYDGQGTDPVVALYVKGSVLFQQTPGSVGDVVFRGPNSDATPDASIGVLIIGTSVTLRKLHVTGFQTGVRVDGSNLVVFDDVVIVGVAAADPAVVPTYGVYCIRSSCEAIGNLRAHANYSALLLQDGANFASSGASELELGDPYSHHGGHGLLAVRGSSFTLAGASTLIFGFYTGIGILFGGRATLEGDTSITDVSIGIRASWQTHLEISTDVATGIEASALGILTEASSLNGYSGTGQGSLSVTGTSASGTGIVANLSSEVDFSYMAEFNIGGFFDAISVHHSNFTGPAIGTPGVTGNIKVREGSVYRANNIAVTPICTDSICL